MKKAPLNRLLREWAKRREPEPEGMEQLATRISSELRRHRFMHLEQTAERPGLHRRVIRFALAGIGAAAALAVGLYVFMSNGKNEVRSVRRTVAADQGLAITEEAVRESTRLFHQMDEALDCHLRWLVETDAHVDLGVNGDRSPEDFASKPLVMLRIVIAKRRGEDGRWQPVRDIKALTRGEEFIEVNQEKNTDPELALWVYALGEDEIVVDTALSLNDPVRISGSFQNILKCGKPIRIHSFRDNRQEYRITQVAALLDGKTNDAS